MSNGFHDDTVVGDTLALVNVVRQAFGKDQLSDLPDSRPGDAADCLFYRALADVGVHQVYGGSMSFDDERKAAYIAALWGTTAKGRQVTSPRVFGEVINRFDNNALPQYVTQRKRDF